MIFMRYMHRQRGGRVDFTREELSSTLDNQAPGSPRLSILRALELVPSMILGTISGLRRLHWSSMRCPKATSAE